MESGKSSKKKWIIFPSCTPTDFWNHDKEKRDLIHSHICDNVPHCRLGFRFTYVQSAAITTTQNALSVQFVDLWPLWCIVGHHWSMACRLEVGQGNPMKSQYGVKCVCVCVCVCVCAQCNLPVTLRTASLQLCKHTSASSRRSVLRNWKQIFPPTYILDSRSRSDGDYSIMWYDTVQIGKELCPILNIWPLMIWETSHSNFKANKGEIIGEYIYIYIHTYIHTYMCIISLRPESKEAKVLTMYKFF
jgi:hypothetical protein